MYLDILILVIMILAILDGIKNGLFVEFLSVFGLILNFLLAKKLTPIAMGILKIQSNDTTNFIAYIVVFWLVYMIIGLFLHFIRNIMNGLTKGIIIRALGGVIGAVKGAILSLVIIFIFSFAADSFPNIAKYGEGSRTTEFFLTVASYGEKHIPKVFKDRLNKIKNERLINMYMNKFF